VGQKNPGPQRPAVLLAAEETRRIGAFIPWLTRLGVIRLTNFYPAHPDLPTQQRAQIEAFNSSTRQVGTTVEEFRATPETNAQVRATGSLGEKPLAVVSAGEQSSSWLEMQDELAALSSNSIRRVVDGATNESLLYDECGDRAGGRRCAYRSTTDPVNPAATNVGRSVRQFPKGR
jgi:hypothetical protein